MRVLTPDEILKMLQTDETLGVRLGDTDELFTKSNEAVMTQPPDWLAAVRSATQVETTPLLQTESDQPMTNGLLRDGQKTYRVRGNTETITKTPATVTAALNHRVGKPLKILGGSQTIGGTVFRQIVDDPYERLWPKRPNGTTKRWSELTEEEKTTLTMATMQYATENGTQGIDRLRELVSSLVSQYALAYKHDRNNTKEIEGVRDAFIKALAAFSDRVLEGETRNAAMRSALRPDDMVKITITTTE